MLLSWFQFSLQSTEYGCNVLQGLESLEGPILLLVCLFLLMISERLRV